MKNKITIWCALFALLVALVPPSSAKAEEVDLYDVEYMKYALELLPEEQKQQIETYKYIFAVNTEGTYYQLLIFTEMQPDAFYFDVNYKVGFSNENYNGGANGTTYIYIPSTETWKSSSYISYIQSDSTTSNILALSFDTLYWRMEDSPYQADKSMVFKTGYKTLDEVINKSVSEETDSETGAEDATIITEGYPVQGFISADVQVIVYTSYDSQTPVVALSPDTEVALTCYVEDAYGIKWYGVECVKDNVKYEGYVAFEDVTLGQMAEPTVTPTPIPTTTIIDWEDITLDDIPRVIEDFKDSLLALGDLIGVVPNLVGAVFGFMPAWCLTLVGLFLGLLGVLIVVKMIRG